MINFIKSSVIKKLPGSIVAWAVWRRFFIELLIITLLIIILYVNTISQMVNLWSASDTYAHGFIVPFISLWLIWRKRENWLSLTPVNSMSAWCLMLCAAALWLVGDLVTVNAVTQLALVMLIVLSVPAIFGWRVASVITFPLLFLFFAVPIGDFMLPTMMEWTADFTVIALRFTGIPVYREGLRFVIPSGSWSVVEACSGIRYLIASLTVGCLFAYLNYQSFIKRSLFIIVSIIVPLVANWLRAYLIVLIGHYSGNELATGVDHIIYGWVFFGIVIGAMLYIGAQWADEEKSDREKIINKIKIKIKINNNNNNLLVIKNNKNIVKFTVLIVIIAAPHILQFWFSSRLNKFPVHLEKVLAISPWKEIENLPSDWMPAFNNAAAQSHSGFGLPTGEQVGLHISYFRRQDYKSKLVTSTNELVKSQNEEWIKSSRGNQLVDVGSESFSVDDTVLHFQQHIGNKSASNLQVWKFYWVNGKFISNDIEAKMQGVLSRISGDGDDGAIIVIYTSFAPNSFSEGNSESANNVLKNFLIVNRSALIDALEKTAKRKQEN